MHRPRYDDWSLPKGKADEGESDAACALREVEEETGLTCVLGDELPSTHYRDSKGRDKTVRYWAMEPIVDDGVHPQRRDRRDPLAAGARGGEPVVLRP